MVIDHLKKITWGRSLCFHLTRSEIIFTVKFKGENYNDYFVLFFELFNSTVFVITAFNGMSLIIGNHILMTVIWWV